MTFILHMCTHGNLPVCRVHGTQLSLKTTDNLLFIWRPCSLMCGVFRLLFFFSVVGQSTRRVWILSTKQHRSARPGSTIDWTSEPALSRTWGTCKEPSGRQHWRYVWDRKETETKRTGGTGWDVAVHACFSFESECEEDSESRRGIGKMHREQCVCVGVKNETV